MRTPCFIAIFAIFCTFLGSMTANAQYSPNATPVIIFEPQNDPGHMEIMKVVDLNYRVVDLNRFTKYYEAGFALEQVPLTGVANIFIMRPRTASITGLHDYELQTRRLGRNIEGAISVTQTFQGDNFNHETHFTMMIPTLSPSLVVKLRHATMRFGVMASDGITIMPGFSQGLMGMAYARFLFR